MRTGIFGGTFDPIHIGHLIVAEHVREELKLDTVAFVPARHPWLKSDRSITEGMHRLEMLRLAISDNPYFALLDVEMTRPGPSYTVDTLEVLKKDLGADDELYFMAGSDAVGEMPRWKDPERIGALCNIVGMKRPGAHSVDTESLKPFISEVSSCLRIMDVPQIELSSTDIRERIRAGMSIRYLVPPEVEVYIYEKGLYLSGWNGNDD